MTKADELLEHAQGRALLGDGGYDSDRFIKLVRQKKMKAVIGNCSGRKRRRRIDRSLYRNRYRVELFFHSSSRPEAPPLESRTFPFTATSLMYPHIYSSNFAEL
jgi:hypothetical protein